MDHRQRLEDRDRLFSLTKDADAQPPPAGQLPDDVLHQPGCPHPTLIDDADHGAELRQLGEDVAGNHDRLAHFLKLFQDLAHFDARPRIESGGRLVKEQHGGVVHEGPRQAEPLLEAARQRVNGLIAPIR